MSVESEILRIQHNIANTYAAVADKGGTVPAQPTSANLAAAVASIPVGVTQEELNQALLTKQDVLTGQPGQVVGFDGMGLAYAARGWSNPNMLDNWYFVAPVNQRGVTGTISTAGYFIDRWKLVSGSVEIASGGLVLNGTIAQILETTPVGALLATALTTSGVMAASYDAPSKTFSISATGQTITAAKLELGAQQTLAHQDADGNWVLNDPPPNKALELAKCQRYQQVFADYSFLGVGIVQNNHEVQLSVPTPVTMRAHNVPCSWNGLGFFDGESIYGVTPSDGVSVCNAGSAKFNITVDSSIPAKTVGVVYLNSGQIFVLDANL